MAKADVSGDRLDDLDRALDDLESSIDALERKVEKALEQERDNE